MDLSKILSITGKPGLYMLVGEAKNNIIVESLIDGKRSPAFPHERISSLKEISIYTEQEDTSLEEVFRLIHDKTEGKAAPNPKKSSSAEITAFFGEILPDYDREAVYVSDMKKVFGWYNFLLEKDMIEFSEEEADETQKGDETVAEAQDKDEKEQEKEDKSKS